MKALLNLNEDKSWEGEAGLGSGFNLICLFFPQMEVGIGNKSIV